MSDQPVISFSIVSWNVREYLWTCLDSLKRLVDTPHEIFLVDNASTDGSVEMVRRDFPEVRIISNTANVGFAAANNQALRQARGEFVVLLNPDTKIERNIFVPMMDYLRQHPQCAAIGPELRNRDTTHQQSVRHFPTWADQLIVLLKLRHVLSSSAVMRRYQADPGIGRTEPLAVDQLMGACMMIPQTLLSLIGLFDEGYPNWFEEVDWCRRAHQAGFQVIYFPQAYMTHYGGASFGQVFSLRKQHWFNRGLWRYASKFWSLPQRIILAGVLPLNYIASALQTLVIRY